ncbi:HAD-IA family hydrolase [Candidatus Gottesmanbacteria bacterium]|nr:HAD-IA family hydrolase [Candidatus Gottesmanbacteria bacterium]
MKKFKAVLFDVDGTLLDTEEFIYKAFKYTLKKHNLPTITKTQVLKIVGQQLEKTYKILSNSDNVVEYCETHRSFQVKNLHLSKPFPNTIKALRKIKKAGLKIAAVTSRSKRTSQKTLELANIYEYFDLLISSEDVKNHKPHPEPLLKALNNLGIKSQNAVMVGDTKFDIEAGKNAKVKTIAAAYGFHKDRVKASSPDFIIRDIIDILPIITK